MTEGSGSQSLIREPLEILKPIFLKQFSKVKSILILTCRGLCLFHYVDSCTDGAKVMVSETSGTLA